jgi:hypothetical protein
MMGRNRNGNIMRAKFDCQYCWERKQTGRKLISLTQSSNNLWSECGESLLSSPRIAVEIVSDSKQKTFPKNPLRFIRIPLIILFQCSEKFPAFYHEAEHNLLQIVVERECLLGEASAAERKINKLNKNILVAFSRNFSIYSYHRVC